MEQYEQHDQQKQRPDPDGSSRLRIILQLFGVFLKIGAFTFGGGFAMLPLIRRELGEKRGWLEPEELTDMLALAQSAPGVIAVNAATFTGYRIAGLGGAAAAILGATLPSLIVIILVAMFFLGIRDNPYVIRIFHGLRPAVFSLIAIAVWQVGRDVFHLQARKDAQTDVNTENANRFFSIAITVVGFLAMLSFDLHPILLILLAGAVGMLRGFFLRRLAGRK